MDDLSVGTFALRVSDIMKDGGFTSPVRSGGLHGGNVRGVADVETSNVPAEEAVLGVTFATEDLRNKVSNTRKAKNFLGKVSNYLTKKPGDSPFARSENQASSVAGGLGPAYQMSSSMAVSDAWDARDARSSSEDTSARTVPPSTANPRPKSPDLFDTADDHQQHRGSVQRRSRGEYVSSRPIRDWPARFN